MNDNNKEWDVIIPTEVKAYNEIYDKAKLLEDVEGDENLLLEVVGIFFNEYPTYMSTTAEAVCSRDALAIAKSAHKLQGAVANFGSDISFKALLELGQMGRENRLKNLETVYNSVKKETEFLTAELSKLRV